MPEGKVEKADRGQWGGQLEFILTCVGFAVGLGNVWRFPYKCYMNGGGAFLIPYFIMLLILGIPMFYLELSLGQFSSSGPITVWNVSPILRGVGYGAVMVVFLIGLYYNVIVAYCMFYLFASMKAVVPWKDCFYDYFRKWATPCCKVSVETSDVKQQLANITTTIAVTTANVSQCGNATTTPSEDYFKHYVLELTEKVGEVGGLKWDLSLCLLLSWIIIFLVLVKGVASLGKVVYFSATFPYIMLTILLVRGLMLDGAADGLWFYIKPEWNRLTDVQVWADAAVQIFYSLGIAQASLIALASYNKFSNNTFRDALMIPLINCFTSVYAGLVIFAVLGHMAYIKGVKVADVADEGPGLAFIVYPEGISKMPLDPLWAILFFIMMANLGFSSMFAGVETVIAAVIDLMPILRSKRLYEISFRGFICLISFILGLPMCTKGGFYLLHLMDTRVGSFPLLILAFLEVVAISWIYGFKRFELDISSMLGFDRWGQIYWRICWQFISPLGVLVIIVLSAINYRTISVKIGTLAKNFPPWTEYFSGFFIGISLIIVPIVFIVEYCKYQKRLGTRAPVQIIRTASQPSLNWGPADNTHRALWRKDSVELLGKPAHRVIPGEINPYLRDDYKEEATPDLNSHNGERDSGLGNGDSGKDNAGFQGSQTNIEAPPSYNSVRLTSVNFYSGV